MTDDNLNTAAFVYAEEAEQWKLLEYRFDNVLVVRSCGRVEKTASKDDAKAFVKREAVKALLRYYHEAMARSA